MAKILLTGIATLDIINHVTHYPNEDDEVRALTQDSRRGGNAANTAAILSQYLHSCTLACTLADDSSGQFILNDLRKRDIKFHPSLMIPGATPTSYISLNQSNGSRTIVHYRDLAELTFEQFQSLDLSGFDWFHFEGRNIEHTALMMQHVTGFNKPISLEAEKNRPGLQNLFPLADVILFSKPYARHNGFDHPESFLINIAQGLADKILICSWGEQGAWGLKGSPVLHSPAFKPHKIIDTIGAGDSFNAGIIHGLLEQQNLSEALQTACRLAGKKCGQYGFEQLVEQ
ncbi:MAG: PfkB family carbohydrate kinase [Gammaproteobacteria bacterium]